MIYIGIFILVFLLYWFLLRPRILRLSLASLCVVTGAVKTGKSALCVYLARKTYNQELTHWAWSCVFCKVFRKSLPEKPLLYSNIPLRYTPYVPITIDLFLRVKRVAYRSVLLLDEVTLLHDSQLYRVQNINYQLLAFYKLFGHATHGGSAFISTHVLSEVHMALRRTCGSILYINYSTRRLPLISIFSIRKLLADVDESVVNTISDIDEESKFLIIPKRIFKYYDKFCYSEFTDDLPYDSDVRYLDSTCSLKTTLIPSVNPYINQILNQGDISNDR